LLNPGKKKDPTLSLSQIFSGSKEAITYYIPTISEILGEERSFWLKRNYGNFWLTYGTFTHYFENLLYTIQPALYYKYINIQSFGSKDLTLQGLVTAEFKNKIRHLYNNFETTLRSSYGNGETITATFHVEQSSGLGMGILVDGSYEGGSLIDQSLPDEIRAQFKIGGDQHSLSFVMNKQGGQIVNEAEFRTFVASITYYLVMFNAIVFIGDASSGYSLFASQRKIYNNDYLTGLYPAGLPANVVLSPEGEQIYNTQQAQWNVEDGKPVWNREDCWPIYLLDDAQDLSKIFRLGFGLDIRIQYLE